MWYYVGVKSMIVSPRGPMCFRCLMFSLVVVSVMLYPCIVCVALLMDPFVLCVACLTVHVNYLVKQFAI